MPISAVAFDVDGTLYPNVAMYIRSIPFALRHARLMYHYRLVRKEIRRTRPIEDFPALEENLLAARLRIDPAAARTLIAERIHGEWESILDRVKPFPGIRECVQGLVAQGIKVAVASDFPVDRKLERLGFADLFACRVWSEETGYLKPHPEPFDEVARCFGCPKDQILYVGNSYSYDIEGAKSAGMLAAHLSGRRPPNSVADLTFSRYDSLLEWVTRRNASA